MKQISEALLARLSEFVADRMGLCFPQTRWKDLERGMNSAAADFHFADPESCIAWLLSSTLTRNHVEVLSSHLTVGETYFLREKNLFDTLRTHVLPELIRSRGGSLRSLRIWSAGCCTGEEAYSIAIVLRTLLPDVQDWRITILATDINPLFLQKAADGVYGRWSFRESPMWLQQGYFTAVTGGHFELLPSIRDMVTFSYLNLAEDGYPSLVNNTNAMDLVFCRNVLMYFAPEVAKRVVGNLYRCLVDGGWLIVSPSETSQILFSQFVPVSFPGAVLYRKDKVKDKATESSVSLEVSPPVMLTETPCFSETPDFQTEIHPETMHSPRVVAASRSATESTNSNLYEQAVIQYKRGLYGETIDTLHQHLCRDKKDVEAIGLLARAYANRGGISEALDWCDRAVAADKLNAGLHYLRATILQELELIEEAAASLKRALYLDPKFVLGHFTLGMLIQRQKKTGEARKYFENALLLLEECAPQETLPESEGITAGRLMEVIQSVMILEKAYE
jgi:chemotaxis protein methyltransferase CheR